RGIILLFLFLIELVLILIGYLFTHFIILGRNFGAVAIASLIAFVPTIIAYSITYPGLEKETSGFMTRLLGGMLIKMLIGVLTIIIVAVNYREVVGEFVVSYLISYFVFTGFEVFALLRKLRPNFRR
ncbi:MAG: hypothetical protein AAFY71_23130, partial [Bacteroidota bacterium]